MMRLSRLLVLIITSITVLLGANCSYYNRIIARKNLVDGSKAYKDHKFKDAEQLFRNAVSHDPNGATVEGKTAQLFLARTLHSEYIGDRSQKNLAEEAIAQYQKSLTINPEDQSSYKAIASLYENLQRSDDWLKLVTARANNKSIPPEQQAEALTSLAAKKNTCANDITDTEKTKKTVTKEGKQAFQYVKPEKPEDLQTLKQCVQEGTALIDQALATETDAVKNAKNLTPKTMSDTELTKAQDLLKVYESARSYKASLLIQAMRLAEMEGRTPDRDRLKAEADAAKQNFLELSDINKKIQAEIDERTAAKDEAANQAKNGTSGSNKK